MENVKGFVRAHVGSGFPYIHGLRPYWSNPDQLPLHWITIFFLCLNSLLINTSHRFFVHYNALSLSAPLSLWTFLTSSLFEPSLILLLITCYVMRVSMPAMQQYMGAKATVKYFVYAIILSNMAVFAVLFVLLVIFKSNAIALFKCYGALPLVAAALVFIFTVFPHSRISLASGLTVVTQADGLYTPPTLPRIMQHPRLLPLHNVLIASPSIHSFLPYVLPFSLLFILPPFSWLVPLRCSLSLSVALIVSLAYLKYKFDPRQPSLFTHRVKTIARVVGRVLRRLLVKCGLWARWEQLRRKVADTVRSLVANLFSAGDARAGAQYVSQSVSQGASARMLKTSEELEEEEEEDSLAAEAELQEDEFEDLELGDFERESGGGARHLTAEGEGEDMDVHNSVGLRVGKVSKSGIPHAEFAPDWESRVNSVKLWWLFPAGAIRERAEFAITTLHEVYSESSLYDEEDIEQPATDTGMQVDTSVLQRHRDAHRDTHRDVPPAHTQVASAPSHTPQVPAVAATLPPTPAVAPIATPVAAPVVTSSSSTAPVAPTPTQAVSTTYTTPIAPSVASAPHSATAGATALQSTQPSTLAQSPASLQSSLQPLASLQSPPQPRPVKAWTGADLDAKAELREAAGYAGYSAAVDVSSDVTGEPEDLGMSMGAGTATGVATGGSSIGAVYNASPSALGGDALAKPSTGSRLSLSELSSREKALQLIDTRMGEIDFDDDELDF